MASGRLPDAFEERVARAPAGVFERRVPCARQRPHVGTLGEEGNPERRGEVPAERFVGVGAVAQSVVEVRRPGHDDFVPLLELAQEMEQANRIGASRQRDEQASAAGHHGPAPERVQNVVDEGHAVAFRRPAGGPNRLTKSGGLRRRRGNGGKAFSGNGGGAGT